MTNISTGDVSPGDSSDGDRKNLPMTQPDDEEIAKHSRIASDEPAGEGLGIAGEAAGAASDDEER
jgi:hypothetical protein